MVLEVSIRRSGYIKPRGTSTVGYRVGGGDFRGSVKTIMVSEPGMVNNKTIDNGIIQSQIKLDVGLVFTRSRPITGWKRKILGEPTLGEREKEERESERERKTQSETKTTGQTSRHRVRTE